jgi:hypothetical protein
VSDRLSKAAWIYLVRSMMQGPRFLLDKGSTMRSSAFCRLSSSCCWWQVRLGVAVLLMNCDPSYFRKLLTQEQNLRGSFVDARFPVFFWSE